MSIDALKLATLGPWRAWYDDGQVHKDNHFLHQALLLLLLYTSLLIEKQSVFQL